ncbi:MAG: hypothetical protein CL777_05365 [Chloroflexi bacterium]|nr:hypothetical protein [Chloroflexota bacterium]|tara:strand:+ start:726 stop:1670 length:945 start_codon:yes stop_codon:yes gene_type:complete
MIGYMSFFLGVFITALGVFALWVAIRLLRQPPIIEPNAIEERLELVLESFDRLASRVAEKVDLADIAVHVKNVSTQTDELHRVMSNNQLRGLWGERIAEDVLTSAGLIEGIGYYRQKVQQESGSRPDFTFPLPGGLRLNMDVKFPMENYRKMLDSIEGRDKELAQKQLMQNVRTQIREVSTRDYIDPTSGTVDCALMLIPSESVYTDLQRLAPNLMDFALSNRVVCCSPLTLFAVLAVIRQASESMQLTQASRDLAVSLGKFRTEISKFFEKIDNLSTRFDSAQGVLDEINGIRRKKLQASVNNLLSFDQIDRD